MKIIVDAMGGDKAPHAVVSGCVEAVLEKTGFTVILVGQKEKIEILLKNYTYPNERIQIEDARQIIESDDIPTKAFKEKQDSSMVKGIMLIKQKAGDVFLSAGNTGALMTCSLLTLGRIRGIDRPALSFYFPGKKGPVLIMDAGANTVCKPENLMQFGVMGSIYMREVLGIEKPRVGLLNVGTENQKGNENIKQAYQLLEESGTHFIGNVEGRDIPDSTADVIVCDGFVGNILLKFSEGVASFFVDSLKKIYGMNFLTKISFLAIRKPFKAFFKKIDYKEHGGVPLLGISGKVMKAHGSSDNRAIKNAVLKAVQFANSDSVEFIGKAFQRKDVQKNA